ncbi:hypothetical protein BUALT_Bualt17G0031500 [Buddleja alternifolia]|uniref:beta-galactosidase n=1 Tax=Buddleja alternifolia TaxID=168488 RepID=A0AAV6W7C0_9LAMI|nr:hypothetical protein BUALT_Bualt17G0031500 [Buddleja alternifolia]
MNVNQIPGLNTLGVSLVRIDYAPYGLNPPHTHPRATEVLVVLEGTLYVGFVTSNPADRNQKNKLFTKYLYPGGVFVFPQGLIHFQFNVGHTNAVTFAGLSNQNPRVITIANVVFGSDPPINQDVLTKAFRVEKNISKKGKDLHFTSRYLVLKLDNLRGFPVWLKYVPGIEFRTDNQPFKIENEYGPVEWQIIAPGKPYSAWAAKMAVGLDTGVPWIMCKLETAPDPLYEIPILFDIDTCNGFYSEGFRPNKPYKPKMWTEVWTGWYTQFGGPIPHRPVEDLAFSVATFVQNNVWQELEEAGQAVMESEKKLKFREENSRSCHGCKRYAAEKSLRLADTRASRLRDQVEELTHLLDELDTRETSRTGLTWPIYMPWPGQWLGLDYASTNRSEIPQVIANKMELSEPIIRFSLFSGLLTGI